MTTTVVRREQASDRNNIDCWHVYILEDANGELYAGQTNDLLVRMAEHGMGRGAKATMTGDWRLVWFNTYTSRGAAKKIERRIHRDIRERPEKVKNRIGKFSKSLSLVSPSRPHGEEDRVYQAEMRRSFHLVLPNPSEPRLGKPACRWVVSGRLYGSPDVEYVILNAEIHDRVLEATGVKSKAARACPGERKPCRSCLHIAETLVTEGGRCGA